MTRRVIPRALAGVVCCAIVLAVWAVLPAHRALAARGPQAALPPAYSAFLRSVGGSRYVEVDGSRMHYVADGPSGAPVLLLLHGSPDNVFTWRHVIPGLARHYRVIAPDLIGFGLSARPAIAYTWANETRYVTGFIQALHLHHVTIVATDIGALFAFTYSREHSGNVAGLAFYETIVGPLTSYHQLAAICGTCTTFFSGPKQHPQSLIDDTHLAADVYGKSLLHPLSAADLAGFSAFLATPAERAVVTSIGAQMPIGGRPAVNAATAAANLRWLQHSTVPKLVLYATPGFVLPRRVILARHISHATLAAVGRGYHYLAEDAPAGIVGAVLRWRR